MMRAQLCCPAVSFVWWLLCNCFILGLDAKINVTENSMATSSSPQCQSAIGFENFAMPLLDWGYSRPDEHLPWTVSVDLFSRSHWDPNVTSFFGEPEGIWWKMPNVHPCLRLGVKIVTDMGNPRHAMIQMKRQFHARARVDLPNSTQVNVVPVHATNMGFDATVHVYVGQQADALDIVHVSTNLMPDVSDRQVYPNYFRVGATEFIVFKPQWGFYKLFHFRAVMILYSMNPKSRLNYQLFVDAASLDGVNPSYIISAPLPQSLPFQREGILDQMRMLQDKPTKLLYQFVEQGGNFKAPYGKSFIDLIMELQMITGFWMPDYQMVAGPIFLYAGTFQQNSTLLGMLGSESYGAFFHADTRIFSPDYLASLLPGFFWWLSKAGPLSAVDLNTDAEQEWYGLNDWPADDLRTVLQKVNAAGGLTGLLFSSPVGSMTSSWAKADFSMRITFAHNCFLHEGGDTRARNASKFRHCMTLIGNNHTPFTFDWVSGDNQAFPDRWYLFGMLHKLDPTTNITSQNLHNPIVVATEDDSHFSGFEIAGRFLGYETPAWASGVQSDTPPVELVNCTPGMIKNKLGSCDWCPAGRYSTGVDAPACIPCDEGSFSAGRNSVCDLCPAGREASESGSDECTFCNPGSFSEAKGSSACESCDIGTFSNTSGATTCQKCRSSYSTERIASSSSSACKCRRGSYLSGNVCLECMNGLACVDGWPNNWATEGGIVVLEENHYSLESAPYDTYQCRHQEADGSCPGGTPMQPCNNGLTGLLCTKCVQSGYHNVRGNCEQCTPYLKLMLVPIILVSLVGIVACFYLSNSPLAVNAGHKQDIVVFVGLAITDFQIFGVLKGLEVQWPITMYDFMDSSSSVFTLDAGSIPLTCTVGDEAVVQYLVQALIPYALMAMTATLGFASKIIFPALGKASMAWAFSKCANVIGQIFQALFIAFCQIMVRPLGCYPHPNGKKSVVMFPQVLCWESQDHISLTIIAAGILFFFIMPFVAWCVWGCWKAPVKSSKKDTAFLQAYRFLFYRFRPDCWWWGLVFLIRQTCLAFATIVPSSNAHAQLFFIGGVLAIYVCFAAMFWPWISTELSIFDSGSCLVLVLLVICSSQFLPSAPEAGSVSLLVILFMVLACVLSRYLVIFMVSICSNGLHEEVCGETPNRLDLCQQWFEFVDVMRNQSTKDTIEIICKMNTFDRYRILSLMHTWSANGKLGLSGRKTPPRLSNIRSRTLLDEEAVSTAGKRVSQIATNSRNLGSLQVEELGQHQRP